MTNVTPAAAHVCTRVDVTIADKEGMLPIHKAAGAGYLEIVRLLLHFGSPVLPTNTQGNTPLHEAAAGGHTEVVKCLLVTQVRGTRPGITVCVHTVQITCMSVFAVRLGVTPLRPSNDKLPNCAPPRTTTPRRSARWWT